MMALGYRPIKLAAFGVLTWCLGLQAVVAQPAGQDAPLPPRVAAMTMTLPEGFQDTRLVGEPDVVQPIAFCFDDRGRLWVAECLSYPKCQRDFNAGKDRVLIFEESAAPGNRPGNGSFSKRTVFADNIQNITAIRYGFGGIWVCALRPASAGAAGSPASVHCFARLYTAMSCPLPAFVLKSVGRPSSGEPARQNFTVSPSIR